MKRLENNMLNEEEGGISTPTNSTSGIASLDKPFGVVVRRRKLDKLSNALKRYKEKKDKQNGK